ncbi:DUF6286 domain-containing protein [Nonomuraea sp. NPDC046570]|uniref:DUF6286 domain-containing protein n=1 Tax=Nonomuraea sp. NPDC046570 TaxID=3155255 RepID=UPI00340F3B1B
MTTLQGILPGAASRPEQETPRRRASRALKPARTPAGVAVALALTAGLGLTAVEVVAALMGERIGLVPVDQAADLAAEHPWSNPFVVGGALVAAVLGTILLLLALLPGRARLVAVETTDPRLVIGITRSGLRRTLRAVAEDVEGVIRAKVRLRPRQIEVVVVTEADRTGATLRQVGAAVGDRLNGLGALCASEVVVRLRRRGL